MSSDWILITNKTNRKLKRCFGGNSACTIMINTKGPILSSFDYFFGQLGIIRLTVVLLPFYYSFVCEHVLFLLFFVVFFFWQL